MSGENPMTGPFDNQRFAVVGLGRNGTAAAKALAALGAYVAVWDDTPEARATATLPLCDPAQGLSGFDALVLSPGIPHTLPTPHAAATAARAAGIPILSDAELLFRATRATGRRTRFAGITGTNGKSTTTALLHHILTTAGIPSAAGGNLGTAALALPMLPDNGVYVLEMSSYMLERLDTLAFDAACLLNLGPDHLDRHGDMAGYTAAKLHVFDRQAPDAITVLGIDDPDTAALAATRPCTTISGEHPAAVWCDGTHLRDTHGLILAMAEAPTLPGPHNAQNAAAATAMARHLGASDDAIRRGLRTYPGLPHRQQLVATMGGIAWVNDSKATNADAAARALACYDRIVWIAGGTAKAGGIEPLRPFLPRIVHTLLIGCDAPALARTLDDANASYSTPGTLDAAVAEARRIAPMLGATTVLLSPACASWDQFTGYDARGDRFRDLVLAHSHQRSAA